MTRKPSADVVTHELRGKVLARDDRPRARQRAVADVRRGLLAAIEAADAERRRRAVLIVGAGRNFIAGADIREFGKPPLPPSLPDVCNRIEACTQAGRRGDSRRGARRRPGSRARGALPDRRRRREARPARSATRPAARRGRHAAHAASDRRAGRARPDAERPSRRREGSAARSASSTALGQSDDVLAEGLAYAHELLAAHAPVRRTRDAARSRRPRREPSPRSQRRAPKRRRNRAACSRR